MSDVRIQTIMDILNKECNYYKDLLEISKAKKRVIIEGKVAELDKLVRLEQNMIFDIGQLEKEREKTFVSICADMGLKKEAGLSDLAKKLDAGYKDRLEAVQGSLMKILEELKKTNTLNNELIRQSLEYIDYSMNIITSAGMATASLYEDMDIKAKKAIEKKRIFDTKI